MSKICLTFIFSIILISCQHGHSNIAGDRADFYGEYFYSEKDISLELTRPNNFSLANTKVYADMIEVKPFASGHFKVDGDTIVLQDSLRSKAFTLIRRSEEVLIALRCDSLPDGDSLLCWTKFYPNGAVKFTGGWENNEKDGGWRYFDTEGKETQVVYEMGRVADKN